MATQDSQGIDNAIRRVAIVGASGRMGGAMTEELLKTGKHTVTALTRPDSTSTFPSGVKTAKISYDDEASIISALKDQDFLIITLSISADRDAHSKIVRAAAKAGVKYVMPNSYGTDPANAKLMEESALGAHNNPMLAEVKSLGLRSIVLSCGFWYEWSIGCGENCYGFDLVKRTLTLFDDGNEKINTSTWRQCGRAVAALLSLKVFPEGADDTSLTLSKYFDGIVYISSFRVSQRDMWESAKRVTGTTDADWTVTRVDAEKRWKEAKDALEKGFDRKYLARTMYTRIFLPTGDGDVETKRGLANKDLGLPQEDLDETTKETIRMIENGELPTF